MTRYVLKKRGTSLEDLELRQGMNRLGHGPGNDLQICDPSISTVHCEVTVSDSGVWVADLGSTNGSYISTGVAACLQHTDKVAGFRCTRCRFDFCNECVRTVGIAGGNALYFCPKCDGKCLPLELGPTRKTMSDRVRFMEAITG